MLASIKGKSAFVKELLAHGADPNAEDSVFYFYLMSLMSDRRLYSFWLNLQDNWTPLLCAAKENFTSICVELLNHGADIEHRDMVSVYIESLTKFFVLNISHYLN